MNRLFALVLVLVTLGAGAAFFLTQSTTTTVDADPDISLADEMASADIAAADRPTGSESPEPGMRSSDERHSRREKNPCSVRGRLVAQGRPLADCKVLLHKLAGNSAQAMFFRMFNEARKGGPKPLETRTDRDGRFEIALAAPTSGTLEIDSETFVFAKPASFDRSVSDIDLGDLDCVHGAVIAGSIRDHRRKVTASLSLRGVTHPTYRRASADDGSFQIARLTPGKYTMTITTQKHVARRVVLELAPGEKKTNLNYLVESGATLSGRVIDDESKGIADATITARSKNGYSQTEGTYVASTTKSDANGHFTLSGLTTGKLSLTAQKSDYKAASRDVTLDVGHVTLELIRLASISGIVLDESGEPISGSLVRAVPLKGSSTAVGLVMLGDGHFTRHVRSVSARSKDDGTFILRNLKDGEYRIEATGQHKKVTSPKLALTRGQSIAGIELRPEPGASLRVLVLDPDGNPVDKADVTAKAEQKQTAASAQIDARIALPAPMVIHSSSSSSPPLRARTDENGIATLHGLETGKYAVEAKSAEFVSAKSRGHEVVDNQRVEIELRLRRGGFLAVQTVDAWGKALGNVSFRIDKIEERKDQKGSMRLDVVGWGGPVQRSGKTDARGTATIGPLEPGRYRARTIRDANRSTDFGLIHYTSMTPTTPEGIEIEIREGETTQLELRKPKRIKLRGTVLNRGKPVENVQLTLMLANKDNTRRSRAQRASARTKPDGSFEMVDLEPGDYELQYHRGTYMTPFRKEVTITPSPDEQYLRLEMDSDGLSLVVRDEASGTPIAGIAVTTFATDGKQKPLVEQMMQAMLYQQHSYSPIKSDKDGRVEIDAIPPGTYHLVLRGPNHASKLLRDVKTGSAPIDVTLGVGASISIVVRDLENSKVKPRFQFQLRKRGQTKWTTQWGSSGKAELRSLEPASYELRVQRYMRTRKPGAPKPSWSEIRSVQVTAGENPPVEFVQ